VYQNTANLETYCGLGYVSTGYGLAGKNKAVGKFADLPGNIGEQSSEFPSTLSDFVVSLPLKDGSKYIAIYSGFEQSGCCIQLGHPHPSKLTMTTIQAAPEKYAKEHGLPEVGKKWRQLPLKLSAPLLAPYSQRGRLQAGLGAQVFLEGMLRDRRHVRRAVTFVYARTKSAKHACAFR
jgi:hypothetical protein